jgi:hypothetical protein
MKTSTHTERIINHKYIVTSFVPTPAHLPIAQQQGARCCLTSTVGDVCFVLQRGVREPGVEPQLERGDAAIL